MPKDKEQSSFYPCIVDIDEGIRTRQIVVRSRYDFPVRKIISIRIVDATEEQCKAVEDYHWVGLDGRIH